MAFILCIGSIVIFGNLYDKEENKVEKYEKFIRKGKLNYRKIFV